ncbi:3-oxoacyl-(acyl-carrier-protein) reductase [Pseudonocardia dioxanivorans CB1190]|uniref:3-oxoacyl-(Acyl-carrier-protein) reductase n=2 Tax=Pseudonocardia dioxanivorans TaxID=240495 RepID=F4CU06_PSEUX|nr:3-oxoacyl-(acyl-carrier-protein) reductase [Pseudonocardia dioxanivorans CB1190]
MPGRVDGMTNPRRARIAIVTGGASGIGRALGAALVTRGDTVVLADVDIEGATSAADAMSARGPGTAVATELDVRDGSAVEKLVADTVDARGGLDIMVNNAGLGIGGPVEELTSAHWDRVVDVNLRGVVHGVHAAYPVMVEQRRGHIVNTASMAGLVPCPGLTSYATTKWGVVGLSLSLRAEAARYGVRVTVVCPAGVDTPLLDKGSPSDLPRIPSDDTVDTRRMITKMSGGKLYDADTLAADVLRAVDRNRALVAVPRYAGLMWRLTRLSPAGMTRLSSIMAARAMR